MERAFPAQPHQFNWSGLGLNAELLEDKSTAVYVGNGYKPGESFLIRRRYCGLDSS